MIRAFKPKRRKRVCKKKQIHRGSGKRKNLKRKKRSYKLKKSNIAALNNLGFRLR